MDRNVASGPSAPEPSISGSSSAHDWGQLPLSERLIATRARIAGRLVFTTSFGLEDQAIAHAVFANDLAIEVVTIDTGRLFPETYALWAETERRYRKSIPCVMPESGAVQTLVANQGINGFRDSVAARKACCHARKVEPLRRALAGAAAWITGVRADQSENRAAMQFVMWDPDHRLLKVNPLLDWRRADVAGFVERHDVPYNPLHDRGFLSIGCAPCTRAVRPGEPERAGRWWWEQETPKECGLHIGPDGRLVRAVSAKITQTDGLLA
jgi:phosphoadenosine phosphosulfate reductase